MILLIIFRLDRMTKLVKLLCRLRKLIKKFESLELNPENFVMSQLKQEISLLLKHLFQISINLVSTFQ